MEKRQIIIVLLLGIAIIFSVISMTLTLSVKNLGPININPQVYKEIHSTSGANIFLTVEGEEKEG